VALHVRPFGKTRGGWGRGGAGARDPLIRQIQAWTAATPTSNRG